MLHVERAWYNEPSQCAWCSACSASALPEYSTNITWCLPAPWPPGLTERSNVAWRCNFMREVGFMWEVGVADVAGQIEFAWQSDLHRLDKLGGSLQHGPRDGRLSLCLAATRAIELLHRHDDRPGGHCTQRDVFRLYIVNWHAMVVANNEPHTKSTSMCIFIGNAEAPNTHTHRHRLPETPRRALRPGARESNREIVFGISRRKPSTKMALVSAQRM